jgi:hypothetical protein
VWWAEGEEPRPDPVVWPTPRQIKPFVGKSLREALALRAPFFGGLRKQAPAQSHLESKLFVFTCLPGCGSDRLHFLCLPDLTAATAKTWWKQAIEPMIVAKFPELLERPAWLKELKAASSGTKSDMLKALKDYCRGKVKQFAKS